MSPFSITFRVTEEHIAAGVRCNCNECPVALAVKTAYPDWVWAAGMQTIMAYDPDDTKEIIARYPLTYRLGTQICQYDQGWPMEPDTYTLQRTTP